MRFLTCSIAGLLAGMVQVATAASLPADFRGFDANHDGFLSRPELPPASPLKTYFANFDRNRDGQLDTAELDSAKQAVQVRGATNPTLVGLHTTHDGPALGHPVGYINNERGQ